MLLAIKGNREEVIEEKNMASFLANGYDIYEKDEKGKVSLKEPSPSKKVSYAEYQKALEKIKKLESEIKKIKKENDPNGQK